MVWACKDFVHSFNRKQYKEQLLQYHRNNHFLKILIFKNKDIKKFDCDNLIEVYESSKLTNLNLHYIVISQRHFQGEMKDEDEFSEEEDYYQVERILDVKQQHGKKYYLVKWLGWDVKTCTWEQQSNISHLRQLIKQFTNSRRYDQKRDLEVKKLDVVEVGMSPYEQTKVHGHVLYGDQPERILQVSVIQKNNKKTAHFLVQWKERDDHYQPFKSLIQSSILLEHYPLFVVQFYQSKIKLVTQH